MEKIPLLFIVLFHQALFSQAKLNKELNSLFFGLNLESGVAAITADTKLNFKAFETTDSNGVPETMYIAHFTENRLITSKILSGRCTIIDKKKQAGFKEYTIDQQITFGSLKEVIDEYNKLSVGFEKFGGIVTEPIVEGSLDNKGYQNKVIMIQTKTAFIGLTFMYPIPIKDKTEYTLNIICKYRKLPQ